MVEISARKYWQALPQWSEISAEPGLVDLAEVRGEDTFAVPKPQDEKTSGPCPKVFQGMARLFQGSAKCLADSVPSTKIETAAEHSKNLNASLLQAKAHLDAGQAEEALDLLGKLTFFGREFRVCLKLAMEAKAYDLQGDYEKAWDCIAAMRDIDPFTANRAKRTFRGLLQKKAEEIEARIALHQEEGDILAEDDAYQDAINLYASLGEHDKVEQRTFERLAILEDAAVLREARLQKRMTQESHPTKRIFFQAVRAAQEGRPEAAKLAWLQIYSSQENDSTTLKLKEQGRALLKEDLLQHLEGLRLKNEILKTQRLGHKYDKENGGLVDRDGIKATAERNLRLIEVFTTYAEMDTAVTLEEAVAQLQSEAERFTGRDYSQLLAHYQNLHQIDPDFSTLLKLTGQKTLERCQDPEEKQRVLSQVARRLRHPNGSYALAAEFLQGILAEPFREAAEQVPNERRAEIERNAYNGFTEYQLRKKLRDRREALKEEDPLAYRLRYGERGPSEIQKEAEFQEAQQALIQKGLEAESLKILQKDFEEGRVSDPLLNQAWGEYLDLEDPLHELSNLSDAGRDAMLDEAVLTALTMPISMGAGSLIRGAMTGSRLARGLALTAPMASKAFEGATWVAAWGGEFLTQQALWMGFTEKFDLEEIDHEIAMSLALHGAGKLWAQEAKILGIDSVSRKAAVSNASKRGMELIDASGQVATQTWVGATLVHLQKPEHDESFLELAAASLMRVAAGGLGPKAYERMLGGAPTWMERRGEAKQEMAREAWQEVAASGLSKSRAEEVALEFSEGGPKAEKLEKVFRLHRLLREKLGLDIPYQEDGKLHPEAELKMLTSLTLMPKDLRKPLIAVQERHPRFMNYLLELIRGEEYFQANSLLRSMALPLEVDSRGQLRSLPRFSEVDPLKAEAIKRQKQAGNEKFMAGLEFLRFMQGIFVLHAGDEEADFNSRP